jgi:hypothetical protein
MADLSTANEPRRRVFSIAAQSLPDGPGTLSVRQLGIRVNAICPGYIETPMSREIDPPAFVRDFVERYIPLGRPGTVEDVAPAFLFVAGKGAGFMTGQVLVLDGGQLAGQKPSDALINRLSV